MKIADGWFFENQQGFNFQGKFIQDEIPTDLKAQIQPILEWKQVLIPFIDGRSGYVPLVDKATEKELGHLKLKGLGFFDFDKNLVVPPGKGVFDEHKGRAGQIAYRLLVEEDGGLNYVPFEEKPFGGVTIDKALKEFEISKAMFDAGISVIKPLFVYEFKDLEFEKTKEKLGVIGLRSEVDLRNFIKLSELLNFEFADNKLQLNYALANLFHNMKLELKLENIAKFFCDIFEKIGQQIAIIHENWGDFEFHLENIGVNMLNGEVIFYDLDKAVELEQKSLDARDAYYFRDLMSFLSSLLYFYYGTGVVKFAGLIKNEFLLADFMEAFLKGYFGMDLSDSFEFYKEIPKLDVQIEFETILKIKNALSIDLAKAFSDELEQQARKLIELQEKL